LTAFLHPVTHFVRIQYLESGGREEEANVDAAREDIADSEEAQLRAWMGAAARGDQAAFAQLYKASASRVYGLAQRITRRPVLAEDVVVETYAQAWRQAVQYDPGRSKVYTWLLTLCRSRAIDALRRVEPAEALNEQHELADTGPGPLDLLQLTEKHSSVHRALATLDSRQRQLLALAFFRDMSHSELASYTGMPLGTVKTLVRSGIDQLRGLLGVTVSIESGGKS
jgi:RNA polymerase sigma-70 factor (ECF subfamily)